MEGFRSPKLSRRNLYIIRHLIIPMLQLLSETKVSSALVSCAGWHASLSWDGTKGTNVPSAPSRGLFQTVHVARAMGRREGGTAMQRDQ